MVQEIIKTISSTASSDFIADEQAVNVFWILSVRCQIHFECMLRQYLLWIIKKDLLGWSCAKFVMRSDHRRRVHFELPLPT